MSFQERLEDFICQLIMGPPKGGIEIVWDEDATRATESEGAE